MGLFGTSFDDPRTAAVFGLASQLMGSPNVGQGLMAGMGDYVASMQAAKNAEAKRRLQQAQLDEVAAQAEERKANAAKLQQAQEVARRQQEFLGSQWRPQGAPTSIALTPEANAQRSAAQAPGDFDVAAAARSGLFTPEQIERYANLKYAGRSEIKDYKEIRNPDGSVTVVGFDKYGDQRNTGAKPFKAAERVDLGGGVGLLDPISNALIGQLSKSVSPDAKLSAETQRRGQNLADARQREANAVSREAAQSQIINDPNLGPLIVNKGTGLVRPARTFDGQPVPGEKQAAMKINAKDVVSLLDQADKYIDGATNSYVGAGVDFLARGVGKATDGAINIGRLKAIEGALLAKMPRMEGPQSNYDVQNYRQAAGQIGDPTIPSEIKKAAIQTVREIQQKYAGGGAAAAGAPVPLDMDAINAELARRAGGK